MFSIPTLKRIKVSVIPNLFPADFFFLADFGQGQNLPDNSKLVLKTALP